MSRPRGSTQRKAKAFEKRARAWLSSLGEETRYHAGVMYRHIFADLYDSWDKGKPVEKRVVAEFSAAFRLARSLSNLFLGRASAIIAGTFSPEEKADIVARLLLVLLEKGWDGMLLTRDAALAKAIESRLEQAAWITRSDRISPEKTLLDDLLAWSSARVSEKRQQRLQQIKARTAGFPDATGLRNGLAEFSDLVIVHPDDLVDPMLVASLPTRGFGIADLDGGGGVPLPLNSWLPLVRHAGRVITVGKGPDLGARLPMPDKVVPARSPMRFPDGIEWGEARVAWPVLHHRVVMRARDGITEVGRWQAWRCGVTGAWLDADAIDPDALDVVPPGVSEVAAVGATLPVYEREVLREVCGRGVQDDGRGVWDTGGALSRRSAPRFVQDSTYAWTAYTGIRNARACAACGEKMVLGQVRLSSEDVRLFKSSRITVENGIVCVPCAIEQGARVVNAGRMWALIKTKLDAHDEVVDKDEPVASLRTIQLCRSRAIETAQDTGAAGAPSPPHLASLATLDGGKAEAHVATDTAVRDGDDGELVPDRVSDPSTPHRASPVEMERLLRLLNSPCLARPAACTRHALLRPALPAATAACAIARAEMLAVTGSVEPVTVYWRESGSGKALATILPSRERPTVAALRTEPLYESIHRGLSVDIHVPLPLAGQEISFDGHVQRFEAGTITGLVAPEPVIAEDEGDIDGGVVTEDVGGAAEPVPPEMETDECTDDVLDGLAGEEPAGCETEDEIDAGDDGRIDGEHPAFAAQVEVVRGKASIPRVSVFGPVAHHVLARFAWVFTKKYTIQPRGIDDFTASLDALLAGKVLEWGKDGRYPPPLVSCLRDDRWPAGDGGGAVVVSARDLFHSGGVTLLVPWRLADDLRPGVREDDGSIPIDHLGFLKDWAPIDVFSRTIAVVDSARPFVLDPGRPALVTRHEAGGHDGAPASRIMVGLGTSEAGGIPLLITRGHCYVPARVDDLLPRFHIDTIAKFPISAVPARVEQAISAMTSRFLEAVRATVGRLVSGRDLTQERWDGAMCAIKATVDALAAIPGHAGLLSTALDVVSAGIRSARRRPRVAVVRPLLAWIEQEARSAGNGTGGAGGREGG